MFIIREMQFHCCTFPWGYFTAFILHLYFVIEEKQFISKYNKNNEASEYIFIFRHE